ncbi:MAG: CYTH domain-containing protein [Clostridiaceae bacterium]|nr:CYTH domain-containing protein [Clostridiaceae bacterium]
MALEIERKFLVINSDYKKEAVKSFYSQGYLSDDPDRVVRIRICENSSFLTIKSKQNDLVRYEFEYPIPLSDAEILLSLCKKPIIRKYRYTLTFKGLIWQVDEFLDENQGLVIAEVELKDSNQTFEKPPWVGKEVTSYPRYFNSNLIRFPYNMWDK